MLYAQIGAGLLAAFGVPARIEIGDAAWRLGDGGGDVISHTAGERSFAPTGAPAAAFHAWISIEDAGQRVIVDFTTCLLTHKTALLDAADGQRTEVNYCPPFLWEPERACQRSIRAVGQARHAGRSPRGTGAAPTVPLS